MNALSLSLRQVMKTPLALWDAANHVLADDRAAASICFLIYHRVTGDLRLELDLDFSLFRQQMAALAQSGRVISYDEALARLSSGHLSERTHFVLTFDDGYRDFYTHVYPLLQELGLPAILFVTTGFVDEGMPYPLMARPNASVAPLTWEMLGELAESPWIRLGAHTHRHPQLAGLSPSQLEEELAWPVERFRTELGLRPAHFSYPLGLYTPEVMAQVAQYYETAVIGGGQLATSRNWNRYGIPRVPIRRSDGWWFFQAKLRGWLQGEEAVYEWLHARRSARWRRR